MFWALPKVPRGHYGSWKCRFLDMNIPPIDSFFESSTFTLHTTAQNLACKSFARSCRQYSSVICRRLKNRGSDGDRTADVWTTAQREKIISLMVSPRLAFGRKKICVSRSGTIWTCFAAGLAQKVT